MIITFGVFNIIVNIFDHVKTDLHLVSTKKLIVYLIVNAHPPLVTL